MGAVAVSDDLPTYRHGEIPDGMATVTMLGRMRRRLARPDQPAVAWYPVRKGKVPLYAVADTVALPPMSEKQHARWIANRTCARCEEVRAEPVPLCDDGRRVDLECRQLERLAVARVTWLKLRLEATAWAQRFHDQDGAAILVGQVFGFSSLDASPVDLVAIALKPAVPLVSVLTWPSPYHNIHVGTVGNRWYRLPRHCLTRVAGEPGKSLRLAPGARTVDCDEIVPYLFPLVGRPLVYLTLGGHGHPIGHVESYSANWNPHGVSLFADGVIDRDRDGANDFAVRWRDWLCEPQEARHPWAHRDGLKRQPVEAAGPIAGVELVLSGLLRMGLDTDHPDGPARCPVLPDVGVEPCGEVISHPGEYLEPDEITGTCPGHAP